MKERKFRGAAFKTVDYVLVDSHEKIWSVYHDGSKEPFTTVTVDDCVQLVRKGDWIEITENKMQAMKFHVKDAEESRMVQEKLFEMGYSWSPNIGQEVLSNIGNFIFAYGGGTITHDPRLSHFEAHPHPEYTIKHTIEFVPVPEKLIEFNGKKYRADEFTKAISGLVEAQ